MHSLTRRSTTVNSVLLPKLLAAQAAYLKELPARSGISRQFASMLGRQELPQRSEFAQLRPGLRLLVIGLAGWVGLVAVVTIIGIVSVEISTMSAPAWLSDRASSAATADQRSRVGFENISQRPLFSRSRRAVAAVQAQPAVIPSAPQQVRDQNLKLKGVFLNGEVAKAFVTSTESPFGSWVALNGEIGGWRVASVTSDQVVLKGNEEKLVIPLIFAGPPQAGAAPAPGAQPRQPTVGPRQNPKQVLVPPPVVIPGR
jgi:hypothetical protein